MADISLAALAALGTPQIIEEIDEETILADRKAEFVARQQEFGVDYDVQSLETDPAVVLLEESAWRETVLRARGNDIARARYLYYAVGDEVDHLGAFYDCVRLLGELDDRYKQRIILAIQGRSTGGTAPRYKLIAMSASLDVADVNVYRDGIDPTVHIAIFSVSNNGIASDELIAAVAAAVNDPNVRMVNDIIAVRAAVVLTVNVAGALTLLPDTSESLLDTLEGALPGQWAQEGGSGRDLTLDWIKAKLQVPGVYKVTLTSPAADQVMQPYEAVRIVNVDLTVAGRAY